MERVIVTRLFGFCFAVLAVFYTFYFVVNIACRTSVQSCHVDADCGIGTVCVDHGEGEIRCAPPACKTAQSSYNRWGIGPIAQNAVAWTAQKSAALSHWLLQLKK